MVNYLILSLENFNREYVRFLFEGEDAWLEYKDQAPDYFEGKRNLLNLLLIKIKNILHYSETLLTNQ